MPRMILMIHQFMLQLKMAISSKTSFWNCFYYTLYIIVLFTFRIIDEIVERVPDCVNYRGFQQETPLHDACSSGCVQVVKKLVEKGADIGAVLVCYTIWIR